MRSPIYTFAFVVSACGIIWIVQADETAGRTIIEQRTIATASYEPYTIREERTRNGIKLLTDDDLLIPGEEIRLKRTINACREAPSTDIVADPKPSTDQSLKELAIKLAFHTHPHLSNEQ